MMDLSTWNLLSFLKHNRRWCPFLHTTSQSIIIPRYLYESTHSTVWPLIDVMSCVWIFFFLKSMSMSFVLTTFSWRWDASHHSTKSMTTGPWPISLSWSRLTITESSAYLIIVLFSHLLWHIFVYRMKSRGESTHPCGEPVDEQTFSERLPFTLTLCVLFVNKLRIQPTRLLLRSNCSSSLVVKIWGWIVLKAEEKSINK